MTNELIDTLRIAASVALFVLFAFLAVLGGLGVIGIAYHLYGKYELWQLKREVKKLERDIGKPDEINNIQS